MATSFVSEMAIKTVALSEAVEMAASVDCGTPCESAVVCLSMMMVVDTL